MLDQDLPWLQSNGRPPERKRIPVVLTVAEVQSVLALVDGVEGVLARLLYGTGMRLAEGLSLRVKDVDFERQVIVVRSGKGDKDRAVMLPSVLASPLREQLARSRCLWAADRPSERSGVYLPHALDTKYPRAGQTWAWHWLFPSPGLSIDTRTGVEQRHHLFEKRLSRQQKKGGWTGRDCQACDGAYHAPQFYNAFTVIRHRHSYGAGTAGPQRRKHDHALHACHQGR